MAKKSVTGIEEMLGNLMSSQALADASSRIDSIQGNRLPPTLHIVPPVVEDPVVTPVVVVDPVPVSIASVDDFSSTGSSTPSSTGSSTNKQASRQAGEQIDRQVSKQDSRLAGGQADEQTSKSTDRQANQQTGSIASRQADQQANKHVGEQDYQQVVQQAVQHVNQQVVQQADQHLVRQVPQTTGDKRIWMPLTKNQGEILMFLYEKGGGLTNSDIIGVETLIPYGTIRSAIQVLLNEGYMISKEFFSGHAFKGFSYVLNTNLCATYTNRVKTLMQQADQQVPQQTLQQAVHHSYRQVVQHPVQQVIQQTDRQVNRQASRLLEEEVSLNNNLTSSNTEVIKGIDLDEPELRWWRDTCGLTTAKTIEWLRQFKDDGLTAQSLSASLKYAWYDLGVNNLQPGGKPVEFPLNYFFKFVKCGYPKPANYKSYLQVQFDIEQAEFEESERLVQQRKELRRKKRLQILDEQFQDILDDEKGPAYQDLLSHADGFTKEIGGDILEKALWAAYLKANGIDIIE
jgi:hypothetical protein